MIPLSYLLNKTIKERTIKTIKDSTIMHCNGFYMHPE